MTGPIPKFSLCIPSRNRFETVKETIGSIVEQSFDGWEIIVSDNSTRDIGKVSEWVTSLPVSAEKIRVIETGGDLEMADNWASATNSARGEYVLVIADRWRVRPGALAVFAKVVDQLNPDLFFWPGTKYGELEAAYCSDAPPPPLQVSAIPTSAVLQEFLSFEGYKTNSVYGQAIPRALNGGYRRVLEEQAKDIWGELFRPVSPDYTSAMALLLLGKNCARFSEMMYLPVGGAGSNFSDSSVLGMRENLRKFEDCNDWRGLREDIVFLTVLNDIEQTLAGMPMGRTWIEQINLKNALKSMMCELNFKEFYGSLLPVDSMRKEIYRFGENQGLSPDDIADLEEYSTTSRHRLVSVRRFLRRLGIFDPVYGLNNKLRYSDRSKVRSDLANGDYLSDREIVFTSQDN